MAKTQKQNEFLKDLQEYIDYIEAHGDPRKPGHSVVADQYAKEMYDKYFKHLPVNVEMNVGKVLSEIRYLTLMVE